MTLAAIDISNNQGLIDFGAVAGAGVQAGITKASEGTGYRDPYCPGNLAGMAAAGILPGVYHFALPAVNAAVDEARWFLQCVEGLLKPGTVVALDMENDPYGRATLADCGPWAAEWVSIVTQALGCVPMLYTNLDLIRNHGLAIPALANCGLWLAAPGSVQPSAPAPWTFLALWQRSWTGRVPGISGNVDLDTFFGDAAAWGRYGVPGTAPAPTPQPAPAGFTNNDIVASVRYLLADPPDLDGLSSYIQQFRS